MRKDVRKKEDKGNHMNFKQSCFRVLGKISVCIPVILAFSLYYDCKILYIKELNYTGTPRWTYIMFVAFNLIWQASAARKYFRGIYEIVYNLLPTEIFLLLYFAQRHFRITVLIVVLAIFVLFITEKNNLKGKVKCCTKKEYRLIKRKNYRWALTAVGLLCLIPSFYAYFVYDMEGITYTPSSTESTAVPLENASPARKQDELFADNRALLMEFKEENWCQKDTQEKLDLSQQFLRFEADRLGIEPVPVSSKKLNGITTVAYYDNETDEIVIDAQYLNEQTGEESIKTLCEEIYHAMEDFLITNMDWNLSVINTRYFQELCAWRENQDNYIWSDYDEYASQPIEASAKKYAEKEEKAILNYLETGNTGNSVNF